MQTEYQMMSLGQDVGWIAGAVNWSGQRMADKVGVYGDPSFGTTGGMTHAQGYGPVRAFPGAKFPYRHGRGLRQGSAAKPA